MTFGVYREVRNQPSEVWLRKPPTRVKTIEADDALAAARLFVEQQPDRWRDPVIEANGYVRRGADVWLRRFTPTGRYKGETHFMIWPDEEGGR